MASGADGAYLAGLRMLARRELSERQVRTRLLRKELDPDDIDAGIARLRSDRALDDRRVALACARTESGVRGRGRARVTRQIEGLGIDRDTARAAVAEVFSELDEHGLLVQALERRLRHGADLSVASVQARLMRYLVGQGFDPSQVTALVRERSRQRSTPDTT